MVLHWGVIIDVVVHIPGWLENPAVLLVLWYRQLRYGFAFRRIPLTQNKYAIVDPEDYGQLAKYKWHINRGRGTFYAVRCVWIKCERKIFEISIFGSGYVRN